MKREIEQFLIEKAVAGDAEAFGEIYYRLSAPIYNFAVRMTGAAALAEDITQEVFLFFVKYPEKFDGSRAALFPFLCGVARNKIHNHLKKSGTRFETSDVEIEIYENAAGGSEKSPLKTLLDAEFSAKIEECLAKLSPAQREVLILRETEELPYEEIARITETDVGAVKSRLFRARRRLAAELAPYLKNDEEITYEMR